MSRTPKSRRKDSMQLYAFFITRKLNRGIKALKRREQTRGETISEGEIVRRAIFDYLQQHGVKLRTLVESADAVRRRTAKKRTERADCRAVEAHGSPDRKTPR
jgi:hypothetical protein